MIEAKGKGGISAKIIADSTNRFGDRITTFELVYHRYIHAEFMTHRLFSRNAASSRAIPVKKMLETISNNPAMPVHWGKNQPGMQAKEELTLEALANAKHGWDNAKAWAVFLANTMDSIGVHKQIVNRLTEPFQFMKVVCTATEYDNFFYLRRHPDAQPEIAELAECMWQARKSSSPVLLKNDEWHVPYYEGNYGNGVWKSSGYGKLGGQPGEYEETDHKKGYTLSEALKISSSCCAQVSYRTLDQSLEKATMIYDKLVSNKPVHASPFEHQATPMTNKRGTSLSSRDLGQSIKIWNRGVTHTDVDVGGDAWSGNFKGWIQHRQLIEGNVCNEYFG